MRGQDTVPADPQAPTTTVTPPPDGDVSAAPGPALNTSPVTITAVDTQGDARGTAVAASGSDKSSVGSPASASRCDSRVTLNLSPSASGGFLSPVECSTPLGAAGGGRVYCVLDCRYCRFVSEGRISPSSATSPLRSPINRSPVASLSPRGSPASEYLNPTSLMYRVSQKPRLKVRHHYLPLVQ